MANRAAAALGLRDGDRELLVSLTRSSSVRAGLAQRARIVLLAADGVSNTAIADKVGVTRQTVVGWRGRYEEGGLAGLEDGPRSGRPRRVDHRAIGAGAFEPPAKGAGGSARRRRPVAAGVGGGHAPGARARGGAGGGPGAGRRVQFSPQPRL